ncbi:MAG: RdgB/HAM1 family non-canonical purine NTP pyrophosphatase [Oscillospiraceae bacterium]|nr:RdgB/HAM1 family non-canonical purine NTP pyrophosphatase [Oscillospiraceae bacterium]
MNGPATFILASNNRGKYREFKEILEPLGFSVVPQAVAGIGFEVNETGETFEENAFLKASAAASYANFPVIADDSGLCVSALNGAPGVHSARFGGGKDWTDEQKFRYLLKMLEGAEDRSAKFVCCICLCMPGGQSFTVRGECPGRILEAPAGAAGFGYDPVFAPEGYEESFAQLGEAVKNRISHRARALAAFREEMERRSAVC